MPIEPLEPSPSYVARQPPGVFGPAHWAVYAADGTLVTMFEPNQTRDDVRAWLSAKGLHLPMEGRPAHPGDPSPGR